MAYTVRTLCNAAAKEIGYIDSGDSLEGEDADTALDRVQGMVDFMQGNRRLLYTVKRVTQVLIANQQAITIGPAGANWVGDRPLWIKEPMITPAGDTSEIPMHLYTRDEWLREQIKSLTDLYPRRVLYEPSSPTIGTFTFWPIQTSTPTLAYGLPQPLTSPLTFNTDLAFAPGGYQELCLYMLAKRLCRPFKRQFTDDLARDLEAAQGQVERNNDEPIKMAQTDPGLSRVGGRGGFDIQSNQYRGS